MLRALLVTCGLTVMFVGAAAPAVADDPVDEGGTGPVVAACAPGIAHRGLTERHVENTLGAVHAAFDLGLGAEVDVRTTRNDRLVVIHDRRVNRTTNGRGYVADLTARQVRRLRTDDGQKVPFVAAVLRSLRDRPGTRLVLDLKSVGPAGLTRLGEVLTRYGVRDRVQVISFITPYLQTFGGANPDVTVFRILDALPDPEVAKGYGAVRVRGGTITAEWAETMRTLGVPFGVRDTEDPAYWEAARVFGADSVITDDGTGYLAWCQSLVA